MGAVVQLEDHRLDPGSHWTEAGVLTKVAALLPKWETELPRDSNWRHSFKKIAGLMDEDAAVQRDQILAIVSRMRQDGDGAR